MSRKPRQILDLEIDEISLVDKGANQHAIVTIAKSADGDKESYMDIYDEQGNPVDQDELEVGDVVYDADGQAYEISDEEVEEEQEQEQLEPVGKAFPGSGLAQKAGAPFGWGKGAATRPMTQSAAASVKRNRRILGGGVATAGIAGGTGYAVKKNYGEELREELSKALTDRDRDEVIAKAFGQIDELAQAAEIAKAAAEEERDIRLTQEYTEIAKSYGLPFDDRELGDALKACAENLTDSQCEVIGKALSFAAAAAEDIYGEVGSIGGGDNSDVYSQVTAVVEGQVSKSGMSSDELMAEIFAANPAAYDDYLAGN